MLDVKSPSRRAALYTRVSTGLQERDGVSLDAQTDMAKRYCELRGWEMVETYTDVQSGRDSDRPELMRLEKSLARKRFDVVLCYKIDRLSRNVAHFHELLGQMSAVGVDLAALTQEFDTTTAMGRLMLNILISVAQMESETMSERIKDAIKYQARQGKQFARGQAPLGYRYIKAAVGPDGSKGSGAYEIVEEEADIIRRLFDLFLDRGTCYAVATELTQMGMLPRHGKNWWPSNVLKVLRNPVYCGDIAGSRFETRRYGTKKKQVRIPESEWIVVKDAVPAIVSRETWNKAQTIIAGNSRRSPTPINSTRKYAWSGILKCEKCGSWLVRMRTSNKRENGIQVRYGCARAVRSRKAACAGTGVTLRQIEHLLLPALFDAVDGWVGEARKDAPPARRPRLHVDRTTQIKKLEEDKDLLLEALLSRGVTREGYQRRLAEIERRIADLAHRGSQTAAPRPVLPENLRELWARLDEQKQGQLLRLVLREVVITEDAMRPEWVLYDPPIDGANSVAKHRVASSGWKKRARSGGDPE